MIDSWLALLLKVAVCCRRLEIFFFHEIFKGYFMLLLSANVTIGIESGMAKDNLAKGGKSTFYTLLVLCLLYTSCQVWSYYVQITLSLLPWKYSWQFQPLFSDL